MTPASFTQVSVEWRPQAAFVFSEGREWEEADHLTLGRQISEAVMP